MFSKQCVRVYSTAKSALATLRKNTGYSFVNCKKALDLHGNDVVKAESWLKEQAQALGWAKAQKLQGRATAQGLVGLVVKNKIGALVEVNCETDFVAKNQQFKDFVALSSKALLNHASQLQFEGSLSRIEFQADLLQTCVAEDGKTLADQLALLIGNVGENASLRKATCFRVDDSLQLVGNVHPQQAEQSDEVQYGRYATIVAFKSNSEVPEDVTKKICQQIIGLNATKVGDKEKDEPSKDKENEPCLIHQDYLHDSSINVGEFLQENGIEILDFERIEVGKVSQSE